MPRLDEPGNALQRTGHEFARQQPAGIDGPGHNDLTVRNPAEADARVIGRVADEDHKRVPELPGHAEPMLHQSETAALPLDIRINGEGPEQKSIRFMADRQGPELNRADQA